MAAHGVDPDAALAVQCLIDKDQLLGPVTLWKQIKIILEEQQLIFDLQNVSPTVVLCHPANRGQLGLNPHTAHRTGSRILSVGCDRDELEKAVCIEMQPGPQQRAEQLAFNQALVDRSQGLLAPINGSERLLSLGGGHAVAFARAVVAGCTTAQADLKDTNGHLNSKTLGAKDAIFGDCLNGWKHTVLSFKCELVWPRLPSLVQRALNASQNVSENQTELETMCTIAEYAEMHDDPQWEECAAAAAASRPPCASYVQVLAKYVKYYSGGPGAPIVRWLDSFAKQYAENRKLGEDFLRTPGGRGGRGGRRGRMGREEEEEEGEEGGEGRGGQGVTHIATSITHIEIYQTYGNTYNTTESYNISNNKFNCQRLYTSRRIALHNYIYDYIFA